MLQLRHELVDVVAHARPVLRGVAAQGEGVRAQVLALRQAGEGRAGWLGLVPLLKPLGGLESALLGVVAVLRDERDGALGGLRRASIALAASGLSANTAGKSPMMVSMMSPMLFCPSFVPCAKLTPVQVRIRMPRIHHTGGLSPAGS